MMTTARLVLCGLGLLLVSLAAAAPPAGKMPPSGVLHHSLAHSPLEARHCEALQQGLRALGYIEGQNMVIAPRYAEGRFARLPALAAELATLSVAVFGVTMNTGAEAVQQTTTPRPIVLIAAEEPVHFGLAKSLGRPGGPITGVTGVAGAAISGKLLALLREGLPPGAQSGGLFDPTSAVNALGRHDIEKAAQALRVSLGPTGVRSVEDFEHAFAVMQQAHARGFIVLGGRHL